MTRTYCYRRTESIFQLLTMTVKGAGLNQERLAFGKFSVLCGGRLLHLIDVCQWWLALALFLSCIIEMRRLLLSFPNAK
jgi:hypothetical protein